MNPAGSGHTERLIGLPKIPDRRGNLSFIEGGNHIPFPVRRAWWIYDVPGDTERDGNAFLEQEIFIIALSGSFDVVIDDGRETRRYSLNRSYYGLYIPPLFWKRLENFSTNSVALVLSSHSYDPDDYLRDYDEFLKKAAHGK